jgi:DNA-binding NtrC family response regulator
VIVVKVPSLNERKEDIPILVEHFVANICDEYSIPLKSVDPSAMKLLQKVNWSGNIRELRNVVERLIILSADKIKKSDVEKYVYVESDEKSELDTLFDKFEDEHALLDFIKSKFRKYKSVISVN